MLVCMYNACTCTCISVSIRNSLILFFVWSLFAQDGVEAERVAKIVELATGSDTFVNTQVCGSRLSSS